MWSEPRLAVHFRDVAPETAIEADGRNLEVNVVFTKPEATLAALKTARDLARGLSAQIRLLVMLVVPYPLSLDRPPVSVAFAARRAKSLASKAATDMRIELYLCREWRQTLQVLLKPGSTLVIGGKKRWWPTPERRLARWLKASGHQVILTGPQ